MDGLSNIFARNCDIRRVSRAEADAFLAENHRIGTAGGRYRYGLFVRRSTGKGEAALPAGTLVAVGTFSSARRLGGTVKSCEWIRYASLRGTRVTGGMSRILSKFISEVRPDDVMSYADLSWPDGGKVYGTLGFKFETVVEKQGFRCAKYRFTVADF